MPRRVPSRFPPAEPGHPARLSGAGGRGTLEHMIDKRPQADRILIAEIWGEARRRARWRDLGSDEETAAVTELRELAGGRGDLLAEVAGVLEGTSKAGLDGSLARQAAGLCRSAGADPEVIPAWVEEGRRRRAAAWMPPLPGGLHLGHRMLLPPGAQLLPAGRI